MECTQKLECTQDLNGSNYERICQRPEQIGFLGICGIKYPLVKGPNKIGRDPQMCNIVLNLDSISRQHAVVNILNSKDYMLMDLDSANTTKLLDKTLAPYIPYPLKNGDTVQFGDIFGIFRLLDEDDDLPMTQVIDIPETPVHTRYLSKINTVTTIPESPDVSDKDDSFIVPSQSKGSLRFRTTSKEHFIKPSSKTISIQHVGSNKIDNVFWNSSKKSNSLNLSLNNSKNTDIYTSNEENDDIHEMETQVPYPNPNENSNSINTAATQIPTEDHQSLSIHNIDTQIPTTEHLPEVCKIPQQHEINLNLYSSNKESLFDIHEAETQVPLPCKKVKETTGKNELIKEDLFTDCKFDEIKFKGIASDEEILFDDSVSKTFQDDFDSQCSLPIVSLSSNRSKAASENTKHETSDEGPGSKLKKRVARLASDSSTDCEDLEILPTQKISENQTGEDDETDCEDILNENNLIKSKTETLANEIKIKVSPGHIGTKSIHVEACKQNEVCFEDMLTQVIDVEGNANNKFRNEVDFEDLPTQVIDEVIPNNSERIEYTQQFSEEVSPFKRPLQSNVKIKAKDPSKVTSISSLVTKSDVTETVSNKYYHATQDIYNDLCSQNILPPKAVGKNNNLFKKPSAFDGSDIPSSVKNYRSKITFEQIEDKAIKNLAITGKLTCSNEEDEKVNKFVSSLSKQQIRDVIGISSVAKLKRIPSDSPDESTPKKIKPSKLMNMDLPNSQEIKASVHTVSKPLFTELSSDSESENNSEEQYAPILHRKKEKSKNNSKNDLTNKLNVEKLPSRIITRIRKPTKVDDTDKKGKIVCNNILRPNFLTETDDDIDNEIITENISRLKSEYEKIKNSRASDSNKKSENSQKTKNSIETKDLNEKSKASQKKENKSSNLPNAKKKEIKNENSTNESKSTRSVRSSKTRHKAGPENKPANLNNSNIEKKDELKMDNNNESHITSNKNHNSTEPLISNSTNRSTRSSRNKAEKVKKSVSPKPDKRHKAGPENKPANPNNNNIEKKDELKMDNNNESHITSNKNHNSREPLISNSTSRSTRSSRNKAEKEKKSVSPKPDKKKSTRKRAQKSREKDDSEDKDVEVRRSKRQKILKDNIKQNEFLKPEIKSILKNSKNNESTVYNASSESSADSPKSFKRSAVDDTEAPSPKRSRSSANSNNSYLRSTPVRTLGTQHVLFTAFPSDDVRLKLEKLGAVVVTDVMKCSMVLTMQLKRTFKLLCAVGLGRPIVGPNWVQACADTNMIVDPWLYIIKDEAAERRFAFNLERILKGKRNFLESYNVSSTPSVLPNASEMKLMVECSGGNWKEGGPRWICVSSSADKSLWPSLKKSGAVIVTAEFILAGVLRQKVDIQGTQFK